MVVIGGDSQNPGYLFVFIIGVVFGTMMRLGMEIVPSDTVDKMEEILLPGKDQD